MPVRRFLWGLVLLSTARAQDGIPGFRPSFIYMSGTVVTSSLVGVPANIFSIAVTDSETGMLPPSDCSGRNKTGDWTLNVTYQENVSRVTVRLTRNLQLCTSNATHCCIEALCVVEALQVSACSDSVVVARLLIQAEIYANTSSQNVSGKVEEKERVIPNQAFQPLGSCPCNLTAGACDVLCCCDQECTAVMKELFNGSCYKGVFGGDVCPTFDQLCSDQAGNNAPDWFPFLCVQSSLKNTPFLGYFYHGSISSSYQVSSFKIPSQTVQGRLSTGYKQGDPILTIANTYFTVPQVSIAGQCAINSPVAFLQNFEVECFAACNQLNSSLTDILINSGTGDIIKLQVTHEKKTTNIDSCIGKECRNVTFAEDYMIIWEGKRIIEMKVTVLFGDICPEEAPTQKFTVNFVSVNTTSTEEFSGNPGYQVGKPIRAANLNSSDAVATLNLWKPGGQNLCTSSSLTPILFGLNSVSGCVVEVDLGGNCNQLRENVTEQFSSLLQANYIGKRGNSNASVPDDWVEIINLHTLGPSINESIWNLKGICLDIPSHLNIQIITADVGAIEGAAQEEILGVQMSFSMITWQVQCPLVCEVRDTFLPISVAVQFIQIPAQPPVPMTRFQINYTEYDCKRNDVCWPELFYPLTSYYTEEPYSRSLAKGLLLIFFIVIAVVLSALWR
nr:tectonic-2 [Anolis sagrei ordinatus]